MKRLYFSMALLCLYSIGIAQTDTTIEKKAPRDRSDTIRLGGVIIIKKPGKGRDDGDSTRRRLPRKKTRPSNVSTTWAIVDLGFTNYTDNTVYGSAAAQQFAPGATKDWFKLRANKSVNVNIWFFMQRLNMIKHVVNLKYGLGLELNNYRYKEDIRFQESPTLVYMDDQINYSKNKRAADYLTVPLMLNFNFTPRNKDRNQFGFSVGASAGYLYSSRQKYISPEIGKQKLKDDFDLRPFKLSYIAELQLGPVRLYGSLASQSIFERGLDQTPYNIGIRLSNR